MEGLTETSQGCFDWGKWEEAGWLDLYTAMAWSSAGWTNPTEALRWFNADWTNPEDALYWLDVGWRNPSSSARWYNAGWGNPVIALEWIKVGWRNPYVALKWFYAGWSDPADALVWSRIWNNLEKAKEWYITGYTPREALRRFRAGKTPKEIEKKIERIIKYGTILKKYCHAGGCHDIEICPVICLCYPKSLDLDTAIAWKVAENVGIYSDVRTSTELSKFYHVLVFAKQTIALHNSKYPVLDNILAELLSLVQEIKELWGIK